MREISPDQDAANTKLRLHLLFEQFDSVAQQIRWEKESFALRNPEYMIEWVR